MNKKRGVGAKKLAFERLESRELLAANVLHHAVFSAAPVAHHSVLHNSVASLQSLPTPGQFSGMVGQILTDFQTFFTPIAQDISSHNWSSIASDVCSGLKTLESNIFSLFGGSSGSSSQS
jgi:hypothetical protein